MEIGMQHFSEEIRRFRQARIEAEHRSRQSAALHILTGIDLDVALAAPVADRGRIVMRITRLLERERMKGARRHWSYDLARHIALKGALDRLVDADQLARPGRNAKAAP